MFRLVCRGGLVRRRGSRRKGGVRGGRLWGACRVVGRRWKGLVGEWVLDGEALKMMTTW